MESLTIQRLVGERLRAARRGAGLTLEDMRGRGISPKYYQRAEAGRANLTLDSLARLSAALGVQVIDLVRHPAIRTDGAEGDMVLGLVFRMLRRRDEAALRKVRVFISDLLEWGGRPTSPAPRRPRRPRQPAGAPRRGRS